MKKPILLISLIVLIAFNVQTSFGYNVTFEEWGEKINGTPNVCLLKPGIGNDQYLTESFVERLMEHSRIAINEWEVLLKNSERGRDKSMWEINQIVIPFDEQKEFDYEKCNVFLHFRDKPEIESEWYKVLGETRYEQGTSGRSEITIYYAGIDFCKTEDAKFIYFDPCYTDSPRLIQQLSSIVKHEFGHALGLGHYVADVFDLNVQWARGEKNAPSIMAVFTHQNVNENRITPEDISQVRSIYGENGFFQTETTEDNTFQTFETHQQEYIIPKGGFQTTNIGGLIDPKKIISGVPISLEITGPDGTSVITEIRANSDGVFNLQKIIDSSIANGTYFATASYRGEKSDQITFDIITDGEIKEKSKIPQWVKNSVRWWSEDKINNADFVLGIQHLIKIRVLNPLPEQNDILGTDTVEKNSILDSDGDGIEDKRDSCKNEPETFNEILDWDGCPETEEITTGAVIDTDSDGIPDNKDQCVTQKEEYNKIQDDDGCPESNVNESTRDRDFDGILDDIDACPNEAEVFNRYLDSDGCPDVILDNQDNIVIPDWIKQNAKWWTNGEIDDENFISAIQYLIKTGTVVI